MKLVERDAEFSILTTMLRACVAGRGGVALVSGPAAGGKTALLRAFGAHVITSGALFLQATASGAERGLPLGVMEQLLLGADLPGADTGLATRLLDRGATAAPVRQTGGALPEAAANTLTEICGILLAKARETPVVLTIDDVQHADAYSLECVLYLARRIEAGRILVVLGESSSFLSGNPRFRVELLRLPGCRDIRLDLLSQRGVTEMMAADLEGWRARRLAPEFHRLSGGNPLLMRALLDDHRARRTARAAAGAPCAADEPVPGDAFEQAVITCLYRSDVSMLHAAWALAVLGPHASHAALTDVLGTTSDAAHRSLHALNETGLLSGGWFPHPAGRPAVLRSMDPAHRARLEARVARVLHDHNEPATVLVRHLIAAEPIDAPWALPTLLEAAERALADDEVGLALDCLRTARDTCSDERQTLSIRVALVRAGWRVNPAAASGDLPELTAAALAGRLTVGDTRVLTGHLLWFGQLDRAVEVLDAAERRAARTTAGTTAPAEATGAAPGVDGPRGPRRPQWFDSVRLRMAGVFPGLSVPFPSSAGAGGPAGSGAVDALRRFLPVSRGAEQRAVALLVTVLERATDGDGEDDTVVRAEQILQGVRLDCHSLTALLPAMISLVLVDELDKAARWCDILLKEAAERGAPMWQSLFAAVKALVEIRLGALVAARESARTALALVPPEGWGVAVASPLAALLYVQAVTGGLDEAAAQLGVLVPDTAFHTVGGPHYLWARGHYYLAAGRPYAALDDFLACGDLMTRWRLDLPEIVPWRSDAAQACLALGDDRRARTLAQEQLARVRAGRSWTRGVTLRVLAATVAPEDRPRLLGEAADILRDRGHRFELARTTAALARAHRELGDRARARTLARTAQQMMRECGIESETHEGPPGAAETPPARAHHETETEQHATAEPSWPPAARPQPVDELSDAELRVATLAARGHTNREIAGKLFITISTVEQHLTRVYRKLGVRRRTDLAARLRLGGGGSQEPEGSRHDGIPVRGRLSVG
ncbi:transcriptional regulator, LuxR family [Actinobacteria bacterium OK074]|nr:transcriptional regulator, LuxR family [Actinobacteria bacterium OK074]